nr:hypothetical protein [Mycoplasmopsis bovis]
MKLQRLKEKASQIPQKPINQTFLILERIQEKFFSDKYWLHRDKNEEAENLKSELDELENLI